MMLCRMCFCFEQKTAYELRISDWSSDVCSSDLIDAAAARGSRFALLFIDADNFKAVNDNFGHAAGDAVLVALSACIKETLRKDDFAARIGGDEFVVIIDPFDVDAVAEELASRIRACVSQPITLPDEDRKSTRLNSSP